MSGRAAAEFGGRRFPQLDSCSVGCVITRQKSTGVAYGPNILDVSLDRFAHKGLLEVEHIWEFFSIANDGQEVVRDVP